MRIAGPNALKAKTRGRKKTLGTTNTKISPVETEPVDTSIEHVQQLEDELLK